MTLHTDPQMEMEQKSRICQAKAPVACGDT